MDSNSVTSIVVRTIRDAYPTYVVYKEPVPEGFIKPSFYVSVQNASHDKKLGHRYYRNFIVAVKYFADTDEPVIECGQIADNLTCILELMKYDGNIARGRNMEYRIEDRILHFYVDIRSVVEIKPEMITPMQTLEVNEYGKK